MRVKLNLVGIVVLTCAAVLGSHDGLVTAADGPSSTVPAGKPNLLQPSDLRYLGAFRLPQNPPEGEKWASRFGYGGTALAYNPKRNSLFLVGHDHHQLVAEVSIPDAVKKDSAKDLPLAKVLQPFADITGGLKEGSKLGGLLVGGDRLLWAFYVYYYAAAPAPTSHRVSPLGLSKPECPGMVWLATIPAGGCARSKVAWA